MSYIRSLMRKLSPSAIATALAAKSAPPRKEEATRYTPTSMKRGPKLRGPATKCPHCGDDFFSRKQRSRHIQLVHRGEHGQTVDAGLQASA